MPISDYSGFIYEPFGATNYARQKIKITPPSTVANGTSPTKPLNWVNIKVHTTYGTERVNANHIFEQSLNQKGVRVFDYVEDLDGKKKPVFNTKETGITQDWQSLSSRSSNVDMERHYMYCCPNGHPYAPDYVTRKFSQLLSFPHILPHDLRHSSASNLLGMGYGLKDVQEWLSHTVILM